MAKTSDQLVPMNSIKGPKDMHGKEVGVDYPAPTRESIVTHQEVSTKNQGIFIDSFWWLIGGLDEMYSRERAKGLL